MKNIKYYCPKSKKWGHEPLCTRGICFKNQENSVSIITATLGKSELNKVFLSLIDQSQDMQNLEWIIVEGSKLSKLLGFFKARNFPFHVVHKYEKDSGIYHAFNKGIDLSTGKFMAFLNDDDSYAENFIQSSINWLNFTKKDFSFGDSILINGTQRTYLSASPLYFHSYFTNFTRFQHSTVVIKRDVFEKIGKFKTHLDFLFWNIQIKYASDYDFFYRTIKSNIFGIYNNLIIGQIVAGRSSNHYIRTSFEIMLIIFIENKSSLMKLLIFEIIWLARIIEQFLFRLGNSFLYKIMYSFITKYRQAYRILF
jgi:glycosyltransferase involved in cell wall biosynthesis